MIEFTITGEYIELRKLLKAAGLVASGGEAKQLIREGEVTVNGSVETQAGKKIRAGEVVSFQNESIQVCD